jgi:hypothetical protein
MTRIGRDEERRPGGLAEHVPIIEWLPRYDRRWLSKDAVAGLTL